MKKENETAAHKSERFAKSEAAGMIRPLRLYAVAKNCYECHTVPNEKLVNVGGHTAGSAFDLVAWSQGEVRHNVWYSKSNDEASIERKRTMHVVGKALDLEHALRGLALATADGAYAQAMVKRVTAASGDLGAIAKAVTAPEIDAILKIAGTVQLGVGKAGELIAGADKVGALARKFTAGHDGSKLAGVDALLPGPDKYKGTVSQ